MVCRSCLLLLVFWTGIPREASSEFIYWTSRFDQSITVGDTNTLTSSTVFVSPGIDPWGIAVDSAANQIYFTGGNDPSDPFGTINRVGTDGLGFATLTTGVRSTRQIELDVAGGKVYWATEGGVGGADGDTIYRANLDGTGQEVLATGLWNPRGLALDLNSGKVYFESFDLSTSTRTIFRANLDGTSRETVLTGLSSAIWGMDIDLVNQKLYWGTADTHLVQRANLDGTGVQTVLSGLSFAVLDVKVDPIAGVLYAAGDVFTGTTGGEIVRANLDGSNLVTLFSGVDATNIFFVPTASTIPEPSSLILAAIAACAPLIGRLRRSYRIDSQH